MTRAAIPAQRIERAILLLRGHKVLLDTELAKLYGVETRVLVQAVKRNLARFPQDFMFQLDAQEIDALRSQSVISNTPGRGGRRYAPYAFTEQGVAMLSSVRSGSGCLNSFPRFISGLWTGWGRCRVVHGGVRRLRRTQSRGGQLGAHRKLHLTRRASTAAMRPSTFGAA